MYYSYTMLSDKGSVLSSDREKEGTHSSFIKHQFPYGWVENIFLSKIKIWFLEKNEESTPGSVSVIAEEPDQVVNPFLMYLFS